MHALSSARAARCQTASSSGQTRTVVPRACPSACGGKRITSSLAARTARAFSGSPLQLASSAAEQRACTVGPAPPWEEKRRNRRGALQTVAVYRTFQSSRSLTMGAPAENPAFPMQLYLQDTGAIVQMSFPDSQRRSQVAPDKWRVQLLPIQFFWVTIKVSCTVRAWGDGQQLLISGRELWIDGMPPELGRADSVKLAVDGQLKAKPGPDRKMLLNGQVRLSISADIPDILAISPGLEPVVVGILDAILGRLQDSISRGIIADYDQWQRRRSREDAAAAPAGTRA